MTVHSAIPAEHRLWLRRTYKAPIHRVFQAWIDGKDLERWFTPNPDWPARVSDLDVRIHGGFVAAFGAPGETPWIERVQYLDIDPPRRLLLQGVMRHDGNFVVCTRYTIDLADLGDATELTLVETGAPKETAEDRAGGWGGTLDNLGRLLGGVA